MFYVVHGRGSIFIDTNKYGCQYSITMIGDESEILCPAPFQGRDRNVGYHCNSSGRKAGGCFVFNRELQVRVLPSSASCGVTGNCLNQPARRRKCRSGDWTKAVSQFTTPNQCREVIYAPSSGRNVSCTCVARDGVGSNFGSTAGQLVTKIVNTTSRWSCYQLGTPMALTGIGTLPNTPSPVIHGACKR